MTEYEAKQVAFYDNSVRAWYRSRMAYDQLVAAVSVIGLARAAFVGDLMSAGAAGAFSLSLAVLLVMYRVNCRYLEDMLGDRPISAGWILRTTDRLSTTGMVVGCAFTAASIW